MAALLVANLGLRFLLELCALAALGVWGFQAGKGPLVRAVLGIGAPLLAAVVWGAFVAPKAAVAVPLPLRLLLELLVFGAAALALAAAGRAGLAWTFAALAVANRILMLVWEQ